MIALAVGNNSVSPGYAWVNRVLVSTQVYRVLISAQLQSSLHSSSFRVRCYLGSSFLPGGSQFLLPSPTLATTVNI